MTDWVNFLRLNPDNYNCWTFLEKVHPGLQVWDGVLQELYDNKKHKWGESLTFDDIRERLSSRKEVSLQDLQPYDILIFGVNDKRPQHFGLYIGKNQFIHHRKLPRIDDLNDEWRKKLKVIYR